MTIILIEGLRYLYNILLAMPEYGLTTLRVKEPTLLSSLLALREPARPKMRARTPAIACSRPMRSSRLNHALLVLISEDKMAEDEGTPPHCRKRARYKHDVCPGAAGFVPGIIVGVGLKLWVDSIGKKVRRHSWAAESLPSAAVCGHAGLGPRRPPAAFSWLAADGCRTGGETATTVRSATG